MDIQKLKEELTLDEGCEYKLYNLFTSKCFSASAKVPLKKINKKIVNEFKENIFIIFFYCKSKKNLINL